jgi:hypothetical protein
MDGLIDSSAVLPDSKTVFLDVEALLDFDAIELDEDAVDEQIKGLQTTGTTSRSI